MNNIVTFLHGDGPKRLERLRSFNCIIKKEHLKLFIRGGYDLFLLLQSYEFILNLKINKGFINQDMDNNIETLSNLRFKYLKLKLNPDDFGLTKNLLNNYL